MPEPLIVRPARPGDAEAIAAIYAEGIAERVATFQTRAMPARALAALIESGALVLVAEAGGEIVGFARVSAYAERRGLWKLVGKIFESNRPSIALVHECGWREVGVHLRHSRLDGEWKDVLVVEILLGQARLGAPAGEPGREPAPGDGESC